MVARQVRLELELQQRLEFLMVCLVANELSVSCSNWRTMNLTSCFPMNSARAGVDLPFVRSENTTSP